MGRYAERCEGLARLLRAALVRYADADPQSGPALQSLTALAERIKIFPPRESHPKSENGEQDEAPRGAPNFIAAVADPSVPGGLAANVLRLHACANQVRERMSTDNWHVFNRLPQRLPGPQATLGSALEALDEIMMACVSLAGFALDDMTRDESWQFLLLGRRLERLAHLTATLAHLLGLTAAERADALEWLLEAANSIVTFRARYRRAPELLPVLHLVVFDETNPHAVAFQLRELSLTLERIAAEVGGEAVGDVQGLFADVLANVSLEGLEADANDVVEAACADLAMLLGRIERAAFGLSDRVQRRFFTHAETPAPVGIEAQ
jgi:uncharacterized alpha-E superfamily protein